MPQGLPLHMPHILSEKTLSSLAFSSDFLMRWLLLLTDVAGVKNAEGEVVTELTPEAVVEMTDSGVIAGGMIPKTQTALDAVRGGVRAVVIMNGRRENACLLELYTTYGAGSMIRA